MTRPRRPRRFDPQGQIVRGLGLAALGASLGAALVALTPESVFADGRAMLVLVCLVLLVLLPANGLAVSRKLKTQGAAEAPPRITLYVTTAALWAIIAGLALWGAAAPNGWITLAPFAAPSLWGWIAIAASLAVAAGMALWARDLGANRRKRAKLRALYRGGTHLVAPRTAQELAAFRAAATISSAGEEIAYRFALLGVLTAGLGSVAALGLSSLAFAAGHAYQGLRAGAATGVFGLAAGALVIATDSIWPAIVLHVAWNQVVAGILREVYRRRP